MGKYLLRGESAVIAVDNVPKCREPTNIGEKVLRYKPLKPSITVLNRVCTPLKLIRSQVCSGFCKELIELKLPCEAGTKIVFLSIPCTDSSVAGEAAAH